MLWIQAKDKNFNDIVSDTIIFTVKDYYVQKKDYRNAAIATFYCGRVLHEQKNADKTAKAYLEAMEWADQTNDNNLKGLINSNLGILYREHLSYDKAIVISKNAVMMYDKAKNHKNKISTLALIGDCFLLDKKIDSAFYYYHEGLKLADAKEISHLQSNIRQSMGIAYKQKGNYELAKKLFSESLLFLTDSVEQARILLNIAQIYVLEDNVDSVKFYLDKAMLSQINNPWLMRSSCLLMSKMEEKDKHYQESLKYYKEYYYYTTTVFDSEKNNKLLEIQEKYDFEKLKNSKNQLRIKHQNSLLILSLALLSTGLIILVYYRKSIQNKKLLIETEQKIIELQKIVHEFSKKEQSSRNILLQHFNVLKKAALIENDITEDERKSGQKLLKKFNKIVYENDVLDWNKLYQTMNKIQNGLYDRVKEKYPKWEEIEFRVFCLTCEKFDDVGIAILLGKTVPMIRKIRNKIRGDIGVPKYVHDFISYIYESLSLTK
ncbi:hypothetical protein AGMMS50262_22750 [Bacteroidia bacterium]|nr:hypothetical protein AGMMS50262_22750 [Bacteroidia bacterium]